MDTLIRRFAARLHNLRVERGLTQEALAARAELHPTYISGLERSRNEPGLTTLEQLAKGLKIDLATLVDFPEPGSSKSDRLNEELALIHRRLKASDLGMVRKARRIVDVLTER